MVPSDNEIMRKRIETQVEAIGILDVSEIVANSVNQDDFLDVEPSLTQATGRAREDAQMRLNLFNQDKSQ